MADARATLEAYYGAWADGNADVLDDLLTDGYVDRDAFPGFPADKAGAKLVLGSIMGQTRDVDMRMGHMIVEGDLAAAHWAMEWTQVGAFMGMVPADGKRLRLRGHDFFRLEDGLIAEVWHCEDTLGVMQQLGVAAPPS
jgi:steroid delta-isomerase-like uncharacterized protein